MAALQSEKRRDPHWSSSSADCGRKRAPYTGYPSLSFIPVVMYFPFTFSVWTQFTVATSKMSEHPREMALVTRMHELQASRQQQQAGLSTNGILECNSVGEAHRAGNSTGHRYNRLVARGGWLLEGDAHRTGNPLQNSLCGTSSTPTAPFLYF